VEATIIAADWAAPDPFRDGAGIAVVDVRKLVGVGELHPIADREICRAVLRLEKHRGSAARHAPAAPGAIRHSRIHVSVGVGEHEPPRVGLRCCVLRPGRHQGFAGLLLALGPGDRPWPSNAATSNADLGRAVALPHLGATARRVRC